VTFENIVYNSRRPDMFDSYSFVPLVAIGVYFCVEAWLQTPDKTLLKQLLKERFVRHK